MARTNNKTSDLTYTRLEKGLIRDLPRGTDIRAFIEEAQVADHRELHGRHEQCTCGVHLTKECYYVKDFSRAIDPTGKLITLGSECIQTFTKESARLQIMESLQACNSLSC